MAEIVVSREAVRGCPAAPRRGKSLVRLYTTKQTGKHEHATPPNGQPKWARRRLRSWVSSMMAAVRLNCGPGRRVSTNLNYMISGSLSTESIGQSGVQRISSPLVILVVFKKKVDVAMLGPSNKVFYIVLQFCNGPKKKMRPDLDRLAWFPFTGKGTPVRAVS